MRRATLLLPLALLGCEADPLGASCGGDPVDLCGPREWASPEAPSIEPAELTVGDFDATARIQIGLLRCDDAPAPHEVVLSALFGDEEAEPDAGTPLSVIPLLTLADGADGDTPGDGRIDVEVTNPLIRPLPDEEDITLRFTARSTTPGGCSGGVVEIPYRTGEPLPDP